jgi:hypothetical protein
MIASKAVHRAVRNVVRVGTAAVLMTFALASVATTALAAVPGPGWEVTSATFPADLAPGGSGLIEINVYNVGAKASQGTVTVTDTLPPGVVATGAGDIQNGAVENIGGDGLWDCSIGKVVTCTNDKVRLPSLPIPEKKNSGISEEGSGTIVHIGIEIRVETSSSGRLTNQVTLAGGGTSTPASTSGPITISATSASSFGFQDFDGWFSSEDGTLDAQAGSHPYAVTFNLNLNTTFEHGALAPVGGEVRNLVANLPPGFIGNPTAVPECTRQQFEEEACPPSTQIGVDIPGALGGQLAPVRLAVPVYNMVPPSEIPAQFAFQLYKVFSYLDASLRSGGDYGITERASDVTQHQVMDDSFTLWGEPSNSSHDNERYTRLNEPECTSGCSSSAPRIPFLTLPTACEGPQEYTISADTWETAGFGEDSFKSHDNNDAETGFTGCDHLGFSPSISAKPDTTDADTPAGLTVDVKAPQEGLVTPGTLATSNIKDTTVTLPPGLVINPGQATGLAECPGGLPSSEPGHDYGDALPEPGQNGEEEQFDGPPKCPEASKVGTVKISTPLLKENLEGNVYVLQSNPPHLKLLAAASGEGVNIKLVLNVELNEQTGQITTRVVNIPEAPVTNFELAFSGGARAALDTPTQCKDYEMTSDFTPWSTRAVADAFPSSSFAISGGTGGAGCPSSPLPFTPTLTAGSTTDQAGGFTDFSLLLQRGDDQQRISGLSFTAPRGLCHCVRRPRLLRMNVQNHQRLVIRWLSPGQGLIRWSCRNRDNLRHQYI